MLTRPPKYLLPSIGSVIVIIFLCFTLYGQTPVDLSPSLEGSSGTSQTSLTPAKHIGHPIAGYTEGAYHEIFSVSTSDKKYFKIKFHERSGINPNAIPHPVLEKTWIIVAQLNDRHLKWESVWFAELVCNAAFKGEVLSCIDPPFILPIGKTLVRVHSKIKTARLTIFKGGQQCTNELSFLQKTFGPHDARVFFGPSAPYSTFGSFSQFACFGQWIQDFRALTDWPFEAFSEEQFRMPTELQRPSGRRIVEKNYFIFWDKDENIYVHYDIHPKRVFAQLAYDGSTGPDLAPQAAASDESCMAKHMPKLDAEDQLKAENERAEAIHQATNSISITLCKRSDPACKPDSSNTFALTIFHRKTFYEFHGVYEPYVMLFQQIPPFAIHGISSKPLWIHGRAKPGEWKKAGGDFSDQTQMLYITSVSWKNAGQKYHGYIDDVLFVLFGIEDKDTGGIDVLASDLVAELGLCVEA